MSRFLALPVDEDVVGVMIGENAAPISVIPADKIEIVHSLYVLINLVVVHDD
jgi:hypothetical protein